ncbi:MAG: cytochrome c3 family protein, partial [Lysobacterales bacterium]
MNMKSNFPGGLLTRLVPVLVLGLTLVGSPGSLFAQEYVGAEYCAQCHPLDPSETDNYSDWRVSGHRFILQEGEFAQRRPLPLPEGLHWDDISFVVGGHATKALYLDQEGKIITSVTDHDGMPVDGMNQYNVLTGEWSDYHPGEDKPYDCGRCHTTGYTDRGSMPGLPGTVGNWVFPGVECEVCHGPGNTMAVDQSAEACGTCHKHPNTDGIEAVDGFVRSEGQYSEHVAGAHAELACVSCHNPHKDAEIGIKNTCEDCHTDIAASYAKTLKGQARVACVECHMPFATLSAQQLAPFKGDRRTHIFNIDTNPFGNMFS